MQWEHHDCLLAPVSLKVHVQEEAAIGELLPGQALPEVEAGCNKYMYYVTRGLNDSFTLLDDVTPAQIRAARSVRKLLTGRLDAPVTACPPYLGAERHYLRAQIARIGHATTLCPKGLYTAPEEGEPEAAEEYKPLPVSVMHDPANWCHWCATAAMWRWSV
jgi:radial spoke head protein 4/6